MDKRCEVTMTVLSAASIPYEIVSWLVGWLVGKSFELLR